MDGQITVISDFSATVVALQEPAKRITVFTDDAPSAASLAIVGSVQTITVIQQDTSVNLKQLSDLTNITLSTPDQAQVITFQVPGIQGPQGAQGLTGPQGQTVYVNAAGTPIANINATFPVLFNQTTNTISVVELDITDGGNF